MPVGGCSVLSLDVLQVQEGQDCGLLRPQGLRAAMQGPAGAREQLREVQGTWVRSHHCSSRPAGQAAPALGTEVTEAACAGAAGLAGRELRTKEQPPADAVQVILGSLSQRVQGSREMRGVSCTSSAGG